MSKTLGYILGIKNKWGEVFSGRTHLLIGVLAGWFLFPSYHLGFIIMGSLWPDCDTRKSLAGTVFPLWIICKHRGIAHSLWGLFGFMYILLFFTDTTNTISFAIGSSLHLILDSMTPAGVKWLRVKK